MTEAEVWAPIPGLPGYEVSSLGGARSWRGNGRKPRSTPKLLCIRLGHNGYLKFNCIKGGRCGTMDLHRAMGLAFLGPAPSPKHHVDHKDQNRTNCLLSNLEWKSPSENQKNKPKRRHVKSLKDAVRWARVIEKKSFGAIAREFSIDHKQARLYAGSPA